MEEKRQDLKPRTKASAVPNTPVHADTDQEKLGTGPKQVADGQNGGAGLGEPDFGS